MNLKGIKEKKIKEIQKKNNVIFKHFAFKQAGVKSARISTNQLIKLCAQEITEPSLQQIKYN